MDMEFTHGLINKNIKDIGKMGLNKGMEYNIIKMEIFILENLIMELIKK